MSGFIKIVDSELAQKLIARNFQYIKEGEIFSFIKTEELILVLQREFCDIPVVFENTLRF